MSALLDELNPVQQQAVTYGDGPLLVLAGAGSGKTRVLTYRMAWLIEQGVAAENILGVTFTNKAADEMKERVVRLLRDTLNVKRDTEGPNTYNESRITYNENQPALGTFHATCARILRRHSHHAGIPNNFLIYDETDANALIKQAMKRLDIDPKSNNPKAIKGTISSAKNELVSPSEYAGYAKGYWQEKVAEVYPLYQKLLRDNQALDFDDLQVLTVKLFEENPTVLEYYQNLWQYILVDEYQDTNRVQYVLTKMLAATHHNISCVGDMSQSIYSFRGANIRNILSFKTDYPEAKVVNLEQNYRSTQTILDAATQVIKANRGAHPVLHLWTENTGGEPITIYQASSGEDEAQFVTSQITDHQSPLTDYAVLYRTNAQSRALEEAFIRAGIPYRLIGGIRFYERREIKDVLAYLHLIANPSDSVSYQRIVNTPPRGVGPVTLKQGGPDLDRFHRMMDKFRQRANRLNARDLMDAVLETINYKDYIHDGSEEGLARWENVMELRSVAEGFADLSPEESLRAFLESVALLEQTDISSQGNRVDLLTSQTSQTPPTTQTSDCVTLMTLHAAKGLEFPVVFIVGMEEGLLPHQRALDTTFDLQEERRLCYVGITRAMQKLYLTYAASRIYFGSPTMNTPSRFLEDLPEELVEKISARPQFSDERTPDPLNPWGV